MKTIIALTVGLALASTASFAGGKASDKEQCQDNDKVVAKGDEKLPCAGLLLPGGAAATVAPAPLLGGALAATGVALPLTVVLGAAFVFGSTNASPASP